jgi:hypothetical protein
MDVIVHINIVLQFKTVTFKLTIEMKHQFSWMRTYADIDSIEQ